MSKKILFLAARPISINDQILSNLDLFIEANWDVYLWVFFDAPAYVSGKKMQIIGPKFSLSKTSQSWLLQSRVMRSMRPIFRIPRDLFIEKAIEVKNNGVRYFRIRFRREFAWLYLKSDVEVKKRHFDAVVAADSFVIFAAWKLVKRTKPLNARASLTHVASLLDQ